jgi:hypothetical protein
VAHAGALNLFESAASLAIQQDNRLSSDNRKVAKSERVAG